MSSSAIEFRDVVKEYNIDKGLLKFKAFLDAVKNGQLGKELHKDPPFRALDGVSFTINKGERVGVIGQNGAGKSTVLKLVGKITYPTSGKIIVHGSTGGILELGAGFHSDLTARDNIYLSGSMYGFSRKQMDALLEDIISVAELSKFKDVPIKKFSSGMKMKLAFAVAMITKPDIVLLDEAFAVGDANFKKKSNNMMRMFLENRTLVLVSHSIAQIKEVCERVIVFKKGKIAFDGEVLAGCAFYEELLGSGSGSITKQVVSTNVKRGAPEKSKAEIKSVELKRSDEEKVVVEFSAKVKQCKTHAIAHYNIKKELLGQIYDKIDSGLVDIECASGEVISKHLEFDTQNLYPGNFVLELALVSDANSEAVAMEYYSIPFTINDDADNAMRNGIVRVGMNVY